MNFIEQESNTAEIRNLFDRSPSHGIFLAHLEETTEVMRKRLQCSHRSHAPHDRHWGTAGIRTLLLLYRRGHSVPRGLCSLQHCSDQACFPSPSLWQSPLTTAQEHVLLPSVFPSQRVPWSKQLQTSWDTNPELGSWQRKPLIVLGWFSPAQSDSGLTALTDSASAVR